MKMTSKLLGTVGAAALAVLGANPALADGTQAGTNITNTVTVNYQVGGISQTASTAADTFMVDRKVNVTVTEVGTTTTSVSPGQLAAVTAFTVTNLSNATLDFALAAANVTDGNSGAHSNTDSFQAANVRIYRDNGNGIFNAGTDTLVTYLDELVADDSATVFVVVDIPVTQITDDVAAVTLTATAREDGVSGTMGAAVTETTGANTAGEDTVFVDGAGVTDSARDGAYSAIDDYTVLAAQLSVVKTSTLIDDPVNGTTDPKAIPGATIEYCIQVSNAGGSATATSVSISDPLPSEVTFEAGSILINGTVSSGVCQADGATGGSESAGTVTGTLADIAAGETKTMVFRATID